MSSLFHAPAISLGAIREPAYPIDHVLSAAFGSEFTLQLLVQVDRQLFLMQNQRTILVTISGTTHVGLSVSFHGSGLFCRIPSSFV
jgi:hypothetical protein